MSFFIYYLALVDYGEVIITSIARRAYMKINKLIR